MKNSGHIVGYNVNESAKKNILDAIEKLGDKADFEAKYGVLRPGVLMFAAGDGNLLRKAAKTCWEAIKKELSEEEIKTHPARFALVELMNIHDETLEFEPIQRVIFETEPKCLMNLLRFTVRNMKITAVSVLIIHTAVMRAVSILRIQTQIFLSEHFKNFF